MIKITDANGRLPPALIGVIVFLAFVAGTPIGWVAHVNWSLRGEANQIIEDMRQGTKIEKELTTDLIKVRSNIEKVKKDARFTEEECLNYSNVDYVRSLRNGSRKEK